MRLVLASNSPRRKQLLSATGWDFAVCSVEVDERPLSAEAPYNYVSRLAVAKARAAGDECVDLISPSTLFIAADTAVIDGIDTGAPIILGKPVDAAEAEAMLYSLRGRVHQVYTAIAVYRIIDHKLHSDTCITDVFMRNYSDDEIQAYIRTGDPLDKAGAYAIQHPVFRPVEHLSGCYANVMGLPVCCLARLLSNFDPGPQPAIISHCNDKGKSPCLVYRQAITGVNE